MHHSHIDKLAYGDSPVHRLDARAKLLAVVAYSAVLISFDRYSVAALAPMAILPAAMLLAGNVPLWFALRRVLVLSPFILTLCLMSPLYDRSAHTVAFGPWRLETTGGWLTAASIAIKFALGLLALTALTCTTRFAQLLEALRRMRAPRLLVMQLGVLYRYLFVVMDEAMRVRRARDLRGWRRAPTGRRLAAVGGAIGSLFARSLDRSAWIHTAMVSRGYRGEPHDLRQLRLTWHDVAFAAGVLAYLAACRWGYPLLLGGGA
jgi:cobalt/nickel transport system permease protein